jgi:hypothetical protein
MKNFSRINARSSKLLMINLVRFLSGYCPPFVHLKICKSIPAGPKLLQKRTVTVTMQIKKNTLIILIILTTLLLIASVVIFFDRRIEKIETTNRAQ